jgi:Nucleotidyl transferase AbiEii toxin, Type IV TA system
MDAERTFWEKATAIHVFSAKGSIKGSRSSRHWHDLARLDEAGYVATALADRELAQAVARHKNMFYAENGDKRKIDYHAAVTGRLTLIPQGDLIKALAEDYSLMVADGLLLEEAEPFEILIKHCKEIEARANNY